jgi:hypothetical protein
MPKLNPPIRRLLFAAIPAVALITASTAGAKTYTSSAAFAAATSTPSVEDYASYTAGTLIPEGSTLGALSYSFDTVSGLGGVITDFYNAFGVNSLAAEQVSGPLSDVDFFYSDESFTVTFPTPVTAVGIFSNTNLPDDATLTTSSGSAVTTFATYDTDTFGFLGFTSSTPFTSATFTSSNFNIAEIEYGAVPEPRTWALMLIGLGGLGAVLRRRGTGAVVIA